MNRQKIPDKIFGEEWPPQEPATSPDWGRAVWNLILCGSHAGPAATVAAHLLCYDLEGRNLDPPNRLYGHVVLDDERGPVLEFSFTSSLGDEREHAIQIPLAELQRARPELHADALHLTEAHMMAAEDQDTDRSATS